MGWFGRKPTQQKQIEAAITVASNLYLHTIPEAEDAPVPLQFSLPDSRYRYLIFCLSAVMRVCAPEMKKKNFAAVFDECLHFLVTWAIAEGAQEFFGSPVVPEDAANSGAAYLREFGNNWSRYIELEKEGRNAEIIDLICSMIHATESNVPIVKTDTERLANLALWIDCRLPTMQDAFIELASR